MRLLTFSKKKGRMNAELDQLKLRLAAIVEMLPGPMNGSYHDTEEMMASLRTRVKYLMFDVEATRRENQYLREMLDHGSKGGMHQPM